MASPGDIFIQNATDSADFTPNSDADLLVFDANSNNGCIKSKLPLDFENPKILIRIIYNFELVARHNLTDGATTEVKSVALVIGNNTDDDVIEFADIESVSPTQVEFGDSLLTNLIIQYEGKANQEVNIWLDALVEGSWIMWENYGPVNGNFTHTKTTGHQYATNGVQIRLRFEAVNGGEQVFSDPYTVTIETNEIMAYTLSRHYGLVKYRFSDTGTTIGVPTGTDIRNTRDGADKLVDGILYINAGATNVQYSGFIWVGIRESQWNNDLNTADFTVKINFPSTWQNALLVSPLDARADQTATDNVIQAMRSWDLAGSNFAEYESRIDYNTMRFNNSTHSYRVTQHDVDYNWNLETFSGWIPLQNWKNVQQQFISTNNGNKLQWYDYYDDIYFQQIPIYVFIPTYTGSSEENKLEPIKVDLTASLGHVTLQ